MVDKLPTILTELGLEEEESVPTPEQWKKVRAAIHQADDPAVLLQEQNKALVDVATGVEGSGDVLRRNLLRQAGERLAAGGGLAGQVASNYLLGILQQEEKALALNELQKERAAAQEKIQRDIDATINDFELDDEF
mgnify:CR=1 FL=1